MHKYLALIFLASAECATFSSCEHYIAIYERRHNIPEGLLHAISLAESGRKTKEGDYRAQALAANIEGRPFFFQTRNEAVKKLSDFRSQGISSMDTGCLQINLKHHPKAFKNLEEAFHPEKNVAYGAAFLRRLFNESKSWEKAVASFHSSNTRLSRPYRQRVFRFWSNWKSGAFKQKNLNISTSPPLTMPLRFFSLTPPSPKHVPFSQAVARRRSISLTSPNHGFYTLIP